MVQILDGLLIREDETKNAMGGTELQASEMVRRLPYDLLQGFQIIHSRVRELDETKKKVLVLHDLPGDPECAHLANGGYNRFDKLVFVSNWQMQKFIDHFGIPWHKCAVIQNAINPLRMCNPVTEGEKVKIIYHTTPHRGLNILVPVFSKLCEFHSDIQLDVYSSFNIYGWSERDKQYEELFQLCREHPHINYHGSVPNEQVKEALSNSHIFAYPSIWQETSCIALIEAMSAGLLCVHPSYAALYETSANWTWTYQYQDSIRDHADLFLRSLDAAINISRSNVTRIRMENQKSYVDTFYDWNLRAMQWEMLLRSI